MAHQLPQLHKTVDHFKQCYELPLIVHSIAYISILQIKICFLYTVKAEIWNYIACSKEG